MDVNFDDNRQHCICLRNIKKKGRPGKVWRRYEWISSLIPVQLMESMWTQGLCTHLVPAIISAGLCSLCFKSQDTALLIAPSSDGTETTSGKEELSPCPTSVYVPLCNFVVVCLVLFLFSTVFLPNTKFLLKFHQIFL